MVNKSLFLTLLVFALLSVSCPNQLIQGWYEEAPPAAADTCDILLYHFTNPACIGIVGGGSGSANDRVEIAIAYPYGTQFPVADEDIEIFHNGAAIEPEGDWAYGVRYYTVTAESGAKKYYRVTALPDTLPPVPPRETCAILLCYFTDPVGIGIPRPEDPLSIDIRYPYGTTIPSDQSGGIQILHNGKENGGITADPADGWTPGGGGFYRYYTVEAESGATQTYRVTAAEDAKPPSPAEETCAILLYYFESPFSRGMIGGETGSSLDTAVSISIAYPYGKSLPSAEEAIQLMHNGRSNDGVSTVDDAGAAIANPANYWQPLAGGAGFYRNYVVTAQDNLTKKYYRVTATKDNQPPLSDACAITLYNFTNPAAIGAFVPAGSGDGSGGSIENAAWINIVYPYGTTFPIDDSAIAIGYTGAAMSTVGANGGVIADPKDYWAQNEAGFVRYYRVTAENKTTAKYYRVTATEGAGADTCDITQYYFTNPAAIGTVDKTGGGQDNPAPISITYPNGTAFPVGDAAIQIVHNGKSVAPTGSWASGVRDYVVTAQNGTQKYYRVTATEDIAVTLNYTGLTIKEGDSKTLTATVTPANQAVALKWTSGNPAAALVDVNGKVIGVGQGTATITVTAMDGTNMSDTCEVTVTPRVKGVTIRLDGAATLNGTDLDTTDDTIP